MISEPTTVAYPGRELELALDQEGRRARGRHFTPPSVADCMARYILPHPGGRVLDPACGAGGLLDAALRHGAGAAVGVDIDDEALAVAASALGDAAELHTADFLDLRPADLGAPFDGLVANPPYLRHEAIDAARKVELQRRFGDRLTGPGAGRTDLFGYFLVHATDFLRPGGRLAFLSPAAWLTSRYGGPIRRLLAREYTVDHVLESIAEPWFFEARTRAVLVLARRGPPPPTFRVHFARLERPLDDDTPLPSAGPGVKASDLYGGDPWGVHLRRCREIDELQSALPDAWVRLGDLVESRFGLKTGADGFFVFRDGSNRDGDRWNGPARYLHPLVLSPMELHHLEVDPGTLPRTVLVLEPGAALPAAALPLIERAERAGVHRRATCAARARRDGTRQWYHLEPGPAAPILWTRTVQYRHLVAANPRGAVVNNNLIPLWPRPGVDGDALLASLNSGWTFLQRYSHGRVSNEGKVKTEVGDLHTLPVLDPSRLGSPPLELLRGRAIGALDGELQHPDRVRYEIALLRRLGLGPAATRDHVARLAARVEQLQTAERAWETQFHRRRGAPRL